YYGKAASIPRSGKAGPRTSNGATTKGQTENGTRVHKQRWSGSSRCHGNPPPQSFDLLDIRVQASLVCFRENASIKLTHFIIGGFDTVKMPVAVGVVMLITYLLAVLASLVNIIFIVSDKQLHKPMYLLICNLAVVDIFYTSSATPTMIGVLLAGVNTISYVECLIQMYVYQVGATMERFSLTIMAFDRLIAIICPLQYHSYLTNTRTVVFTYILWIVACSFVLFTLVTATPLPHCYSRLRYTFCDYAAVMRTTCVDPE
ncbi:olfactory receptor 6M1-like, partial [Haplochromis burtoni]|uniref:olfactory receptor 6M1-like n=1 Tax=Haplochromis burtoni TaxID=8153 RepID=UPI001C2D1741